MRQHPRKRFGQHFLHDRHTIERIVAAIAPYRGQRMLEIGPGLGAITVPLLAQLASLDVVELDRDLIPRLEARCAPHGTLKVHNADILTFDIEAICAQAGGLRIVGNVPYNISTPLLFHLLESTDVIRDMHFLLQKEVVDRLAAAPGTRAYGRLSVMAGARTEATRLFDVGPDAFSPPPKVDSAFVKLAPHRESPVAEPERARFALIVSRAFAQRRKTLRNTLKGLLSEKDIAVADIDPGLRAEALSVEQFAKLARQVAVKTD
ncbi:MAG: 16S rRNA (adenine(1518)-N(6)/adenine(1519)-N(6))-dimethyltransferase RsmA [Gammaproteobacteria bacterium]